VFAWFLSATRPVLDEGEEIMDVDAGREMELTVEPQVGLRTEDVSMANHDLGDKSGPAGVPRPSEKTQASKGSSKDVLASVADTARDAGAKVKETVSATTSAATDHFKDLLDKQIGNHISSVGVLASSIKRAADDIEQKSPIAAGLIRNLSVKVEEFAESYEDETVEQLVRSASDFTRREPALVFGLAAFAGFLIFRTIKSAPSPTQSPSIQPNESSRV
jgi:ElaB/YqjD/DUF883 family membrane-anchored ribosome-binding protein